MWTQTQFFQKIRKYKAHAQIITFKVVTESTGILTEFLFIRHDLRCQKLGESQRQLKHVPDIWINLLYWRPKYPVTAGACVVRVKKNKSVYCVCTQ